MTKSNPNLKLPEVLAPKGVKITKSKMRALLGVADWLRETIRKTGIIDVVLIVYRPDSVRPFTRFEVAIKNSYVSSFTFKKLSEEGFDFSTIRVSDKTYLEFIKYHNPPLHPNETIANAEWDID